MGSSSDLITIVVMTLFTMKVMFIKLIVFISFIVLFISLDSHFIPVMKFFFENYVHKRIHLEFDRGVVGYFSTPWQTRFEKSTLLAEGLISHICSPQPDTSFRCEFPGLGLVNRGNLSVVPTAQSCSSFLPIRGGMDRLSRPGATV